MSRVVFVIFGLYLFQFPLVYGSIVADSNGLTLKANSSRVEEGFLSGCVCSPSKRGFNEAARKCVEDALRRYNGAVVFAFDRKLATKEYRKAATASFEKCARTSSHELAINAEAWLRKSNNWIPLCPYDTETGKNLVPANNGATWISTGMCSTSSITSALVHAANQGCVAAEHLHGYDKQYGRDLQRFVLCNEGFCATPHHALIYSGRWTNMKQLCNSAHWEGKCTESFIWVNNLAVWGTRRVTHAPSGITFTPYDTRFPRYITWILQIALSTRFIVVVMLIWFIHFVWTRKTPQDATPLK